MENLTKYCMTTVNSLHLKYLHFLQRNNIKDKSIPARYPQLQGKIEVYNKIVKNEFLAVENIRNVEDGRECMPCL